MIFSFTSRNSLTDGCLRTGSKSYDISGSDGCSIAGSVGWVIIGSVGGVNLFAGQL